MKKIFFVLAAVFASTFGASAQSRSSCTILGIETRRWRDWNDLGDHGDGYRHHFASMEIGFNGLRKGPNAYGIYSGPANGFMDVNMSRSLGWTFNLVAFGTRISRDNTVGLAASIGLAVNDYTFHEPIRMGTFNGRLVAIETDERLKKSKLNTVALHIPVVFEVNTGRGSFIAAGAYADLLIGSHFKSKFPKEKLRRTYTNFAQVGLTARAGWHDFYVYGNYGLTDLIDHSHGPALRPFSFGVGVGF